jgi:sortase A
VKLAPPRPLDGPTSRPLSEPSTAPRAGALLPRTAVRRRGLIASNPRLARRLLRVLAILLGVIGGLALIDGALTLVWQEPVSGLLAHISQDELAKSLNALDHQHPTTAVEQALDGLPTDEQRIAYFARNLELTAQPGQAVGRIEIPRIGADYVVVAGTSTASLRKGPGIYSGTSMPGLSGTVGIAGHRTTYLAPFRRINELTPGDLITVEMPYGIFTYTVTGHRIVSPNDVGVLRPVGYDQLVLTACNPLYSASQRLAVFARLTSSVPTGLALSTSIPATPAAATQVIPTAGVARAVLGAPSPAGLAPPVPVGPVTSAQNGQILFGTTPSDTRAVATKPTHPTRRTSSPTKSSSSTSAARSTASAPAVPPAVALPRQPTEVTPIVRPREPVTVSPTKPAQTPRTKPSAGSPTKPSSTGSPTASKPGTTTSKTSAPSTSSTSAPSTSASGESQTRVQGQPGGDAPIIGASD